MAPKERRDELLIAGVSAASGLPISTGKAGETDRRSSSADTAALHGWCALRRLANTCAQRHQGSHDENVVRFR